MRILSCSLQNFASYEKLEFDFTNQGLALIQGPTGAGKSTLCDAVPWVLFGRSAKGGSVDEILSWYSKETTTGTARVEIGGVLLEVTRSRKPNDLYFNKPSEAPTRGKDLIDTQKLINQALGLDYDLYMAGSYYHEFSQTAQFFTATAKNRRLLCEQLVDLSLATNLQEKLTKNKSDLRQAHRDAAAEIIAAKQSVKHFEHLYKYNFDQAKSHKIQKQNTIAEYEAKSLTFEQTKANALEKEREILTALVASQAEVSASKESELRSQLVQAKQEKCHHCGAPTQHTSVDAIKEELNAIDKHRWEQKEIAKQIDRALKAINFLEKSENIYPSEIKRIEAEPNGWAELNKEIDRQLIQARTTFDIVSSKGEKLNRDLTDLELLSDITNDYRVTTVKNTINALQDKTNALLTAHFDAEIKVSFAAGEADKIEVEILKDDNICSYAQLSKGQRQLLKLCFGIAVMEIVANHNGVSFNSVFIDEGFDGLSEQLKIKAFGLLNSLATNYESVFVVEHSEELKSRFHNKYSVELINGKSQIEKA